MSQQHTAKQKALFSSEPRIQSLLMLMEDIYMSHQENEPPITDNNKKLCFLEFVIQSTMRGCLNIKLSSDIRHMYSAPSAKIHQKCLYYNMQINYMGKNYPLLGTAFIATEHASE